MRLTRATLDPMGCGMAYCDHDHSVLYFRSKCHLHDPVEVRYEKATGEVVVSCSRCKQEVTRVAVEK